MFIVKGPLDAKEVADFLGNDPESGAADVFYGFVRNENNGRKVIQLDYEAYEVMAEAEIGRIMEEAGTRFAVNRMLVRHATGALFPGDLVVVTAATAKHRAEAFEACRFLIEEVKKRVPIWKKEFYEDGSEWLGV